MYAKAEQGYLLERKLVRDAHREAYCRSGEPRIERIGVAYVAHQYVSQRLPLLHPIWLDKFFAMQSDGFAADEGRQGKHVVPARWHTDVPRALRPFFVAKFSHRLSASHKDMLYVRYGLMACGTRCRPSLYETTPNHRVNRQGQGYKLSIIAHAPFQSCDRDPQREYLG
jgi:hypothetical protein